MAADISKEDAIELAESFGEAIKSQKSKNLSKICVEGDDEDLIDLFEAMTTSSEAKGDTKDIHEAIFESLDYEVQKKSFEETKKGAKIEVLFTVKDFENIDTDECEDMYDFLDLLDDTDDTVEISVELEVKEDDGDLLVANAEDALNDIYVWKDFEVEYAEVVIETTTTEEPDETTTTSQAVAATGDYADGVDRTVFVYEGNIYESPYTYENVTLIECDIEIKSGYEDLDWENDVTCDLYYEDEYVDTLDVRVALDGGVYYAYVIPGVLTHKELQDSESLYLKAGYYDFMFYDAEDTLIAYDYCYVDYIDYGYDFDVTFGDSSELNNILFVDYYYIDPTGVEIDMYMNNTTYELKYQYIFAKDGTALFDSGIISANGAFLTAWMVPDDIGADVFDAGAYTVTIYDASGNVILESNFAI